MRKVFLRSDGNAEIGMGHVTRTMALASMISRDFECTLYTQFRHSKIKNKCGQEGIDLKVLTLDHENDFVNHLDGSEIVVLDNYYFDTDFQVKIKSKGCKLVSIDDIHQNHFVSDLVINHSPAARGIDYSYEPATKLLLGLDYVLLRKSFFVKAKESKFPNQSLSKIFLCFGGSDFKNLTKRFLEELTKNTPFFVDVVVGPAYQYGSDLMLFSSHPKVRVFQALNEEEIADLIQDADLAIVPSSGILFECLALKTRFITGYYAENQKEIAEYFRCIDSNISIGDMSNASISGQLEKLKSNPYPDELISLIDGHSDERILNEFRNL